MATSRPVAVMLQRGRAFEGAESTGSSIDSNTEFWLQRGRAFEGAESSTLSVDQIVANAASTGPRF